MDDLVSLGRTLPELERLQWSKGQGARRTAFLCYSSGTSGLPVSMLPAGGAHLLFFLLFSLPRLTSVQKAVMISHRNVIANVMPYALYESHGRKLFGVDPQVVLGLLPFSHIYALVLVAHGSPWRGDEVIVLPKFELTQYLQAIERFKINHLLIVRPRRDGSGLHAKPIDRPLIVQVPPSLCAC